MRVPDGILLNGVSVRFSGPEQIKLVPILFARSLCWLAFQRLSFPKCESRSELEGLLLNEHC